MTPSGHSFVLPVKGIDPVSNGTFLLDHFYNRYNEDDVELYRGELVIAGGISQNPFYALLVKTPLLLQGRPLVVLISSNEKVFIKIEGIFSWDEVGSSGLSVTCDFIFLDGLGYMECLHDFNEQNKRRIDNGTTTDKSRS